ncbi:MAG TPA: NAD-dependent epimerase/dehydratase family protein [Xanthobacteraceae bacterium]|nr:NAD-dependent epimerase/dehydratase family protein [Xanthobacteraceae bacterium]
MRGQILVLGAAGRLGFAACEAFRDAGWSVKGLVRPDAGWRAPKGIDVIQTNDRAVAVKEARGTDIVLHALNAPYPGWAQHALPLAYSAIEAAEQSGATLMFPGNVYNYGAKMPAVLDEATEMNPTSNKGKIRSEIELRLREASDRGVRTIVLRAGDFFGRGRGSWFDLVLIKELAKNKVTYPGSLDVVHEWAYLPDYIDALIKLAAIRDMLGQYETFGFPGHAVTGQEFVSAIAKATGRKLKVGHINWWMMRTVGSIWQMGRELAEIGYLWDVPHRIDGTKLKAAIGEVPHTPLATAVTRSLRELDAIA